MLKVYGAAKTRSMRVVWALEELGVAYDYQPIDLAAGMARQQEFLAINPAGKLPALDDDGFILTESAAILEYLADKFPEKGLIPEAATQARARHQQWCYFIMSELEQPLWTIGKHKFALPKEQRVAEVLNTAAWEFQRALNLIAEGLAEQEFLLGNSFTMVDILAAQTLLWGAAFKQPIEQENLQAYMQRTSSRPALAAALERESPRTETR